MEEMKRFRSNPFGAPPLGGTVGSIFQDGIGRTAWARSVAAGLWVMSLWLLAAAGAQGATVSAQVQPSQARPNQVVNYVITVQNGQVNAIPNLRLPLQIGQNSAVSTSQQYSIINNQQTVTLQFSWGLAASEPGEFVIPPQDVVVDGQALKTNEVKLTVVQGADPQRRRGTESPRDANEPLLQIEVGKKEFYQGEVVPITASLYVPRQTQLRRLGLIDIEKTDFAIARFPQQSEQTATSIDNMGYVVLTFRSTLSSLRTGDLKLGPATMELLVDVPMEGGGRQNVFPPGFPQAFFGVPSEPRKMVISSQAVNVKVLPLPAEGKPAKFSGAVGDFSLSASGSPTTLNVGDPLSVELVVEGTGNFDALTAPTLVTPDAWKLYPPKRYNIEGQLDQNQMPTLERKVGYSQVLVPEAVHPALPPFELNFFSPSKKQYVTLRTQPIPLSMSPAPNTPAAGTAAGATTVEGVPPPPVPTPQPDITDIVVRAPSSARWVTPTGTLLVRQPRFWAVQSVPVGLFVLACVLAVVRRRRESLSQGRAGDLRSAWRTLQDSGLSDSEFLHCAAQFIHLAQADGHDTEPEIRAILERYEAGNFAGASARPLEATERQTMLQTLAALMRRRLKETAVPVMPHSAPVVTLIALGMTLGSLQAQSPASAPAPAAPDAVYQEAKAELEKGNFTRAQYLAESLTKKKPPQLSPEVFEIIGHARYRQGDLGRAALWYQRAELFNPRAPELRQNLRHLYEKTRYLSFAVQSPLREASLWLTPNGWITIAAAGVWLILLAMACRVLLDRHRASNTTARGWAVGLSTLGLALAVPASALAAVRPAGAARVKDVSVVTQPDARAYTAATVTAGSVIDLPPGSQVRILEERGAWLYVEIPSNPENLRGWVERPILTPLWAWELALVP